MPERQVTQPDGRPVAPSDVAPEKVAPHSKDKRDADPVEPDVALETGTKIEEKFEEALTRLPPG